MHIGANQQVQATLDSAPDLRRCPNAARSGNGALTASNAWPSAASRRPTMRRTNSRRSGRGQARAQPNVCWSTRHWAMKTERCHALS
jgi:hypothetical protein